MENLKAYMTRLSIKGAKKLENEIVLEFAPKNIHSNTDLGLYNVKSIYGMNGSGKSGIVQAMNIYKKILLDKSMLFDKDGVRYIEEMINKKSKKLEIDVSFLFTVDNETPKIYRHKIVLKINTLMKGKPGSIIINEEQLSFRGTSKNSKEYILFHSNGGEYVKGELSEYLLEKSTNLLDHQSIIGVYQDLFEKDDKYDKDQRLVAFWYFATNIFICRTTEDEHEKRWFLKEDDKSMYPFLHFTGDFIPSERIEDYKKQMESLEKFVKLFKVDLNKIELKFKEVSDNVSEVDKYFVYDDFKVHYEYESTGVKKIMELYYSIKAAANNKIVFIDEFDANINDIYLMKLIEYVSEETKGQLIFTTHNVSPMKVLKGKKKSIDFLTMNGEIISTTKRGNYSIENLYRAGMIEGLPFNINSYDFISIFSPKTEGI